MKRFLILTVLVAGLHANWARTFGGGMVEYGANIIRTSDGGFAIAGSTFSYGSSGEMVLGKTDATGHLLWAKGFGGTSYEYGNAVAQTYDGGYAVVGLTYSYGAGGYDLFLVKTDASGTMQWARTFGGSGYDQAHSVIQTADSGLVVAGETQSFGSGPSEFLVTKFSSTGTLQWARTVGGTSVDEAFYMSATSDGGYIMAGRSGSFGSGYLVAKFNSGNTLDWARMISGGYYYSFIVAGTVIGALDGGYIVTMSGWDYGSGCDDIITVKLSSTGAFEWGRAAGTPINDMGHGMVQTPDSGYVVSGATEEYNTGPMEMVVLKYAKDGTYLWAKSFDHDGTDDEAYCLTLASDNDIIVFGTYSNDFGISEFDPSGANCLAINWSPTVMAITPTASSCSPTVTPITATATSITPNAITITPPSATQCELDLAESEAGNPFGMWVSEGKVHFTLPADAKVSIRVYDACGRLVDVPWDGNLGQGKHEVGLSGLSCGVYMVEMLALDQRVMAKAVVATQ